MDGCNTTHSLSGTLDQLRVTEEMMAAEPMQPKQRLVKIDMIEFGQLIADFQNLAAPFVFKNEADSCYYCDADELRRWRKLRDCPPQSGKQ
jgi:hypothetical protein